MVHGHLYLIRLWEVRLLALLDWPAGVGFLAWVSHGYTSALGYLVQALWTTLGHLVCSQEVLFIISLPLALMGVSHQMLGASRSLPGMASF